MRQCVHRAPCPEVSTCAPSKLLIILPLNLYFVSDVQWDKEACAGGLELIDYLEKYFSKATRNKIVRNIFEELTKNISAMQ